MSFIGKFFYDTLYSTAVEHRRQTVMLQVLTENLINAVLVTWMYFNINFGKFS